MAKEAGLEKLWPDEEEVAAEDAPAKEAATAAKEVAPDDAAAEVGVALEKPMEFAAKDATTTEEVQDEGATGDDAPAAGTAPAKKAKVTNHAKVKHVKVTDQDKGKGHRSRSPVKITNQGRGQGHQFCSRSWPRSGR